MGYEYISNLQKPSPTRKKARNQIQIMRSGIAMLINFNPSTSPQLASP